MRFSPSSLAQYKLCPRRWAFRKLAKLPEKEKRGTSMGTEVHLALERYGKRESLAGISPEAIKCAQPGLKMVQREHEQGLESMEEYEFEFTFEGNLYSGKIDRIVLFPDRVLVRDWKAQPVDEPVLTPRGWVRMGDLQPGDSVIGSDGRPTKVVAVWPQGTRTAYRVSFSDGGYARCDAEHLWTVREKTSRGDDGWRKQKTLTVNQMLEKGLRFNGWRYSLDLVKPVLFEERDLPIDPYTLGVLLGDGCFSQRAIDVTTADPDIIALCRLPKGCKFSGGKGKKEAKAKTYGIIRDGTKNNEFGSLLDSLGLRGHTAHHKFVPEQYKLGSVGQRLEILRGLFDTDGCVVRDYRSIQYTTVSGRLADDVKELVESLGGLANLHPYEKAFDLYCTLPDGVIPVKCERKLKSFLGTGRVFERQCSRRIVAVEPDGEAEMQCITVEAPDSLYVTRSHALTHNSLKDFGYALNEAELLDDEQGTIYAMAAYEAGAERVTDQWVYLCTQKPDIRIVQVEQLKDRVVRRLAVINEQANEMKKLSEELAPGEFSANIGACHSYGQLCSYHMANGGPCNPFGETKEVVMASLADRIKAKKLTPEMLGMGDDQASKPVAALVPESTETLVESKGLVEKAAEVLQQETPAVSLTPPQTVVAAPVAKLSEVVVEETPAEAQGAQVLNAEGKVLADVGETKKPRGRPTTVKSAPAELLALLQNFRSDTLCDNASINVGDVHVSASWYNQK